MNDHDKDIIERGLNKQLTPYEKVLFEQERRRRWREQQREIIDRQFDWFVKDALGEFYHYDPTDD